MWAKYGLAAALAFTPMGGLAQDIGNPIGGLEVATEICSSCHNVLPRDDWPREPDPLPFDELVALPFEEIANTPGVTAMALIAWLTTSHPTMPNIILEDEDLRNVVAYILSLEDDEEDADGPT